MNAFSNYWFLYAILSLRWLNMVTEMSKTCDLFRKINSLRHTPDGADMVDMKEGEERQNLAHVPNVPIVPDVPNAHIVLII